LPIFYVTKSCVYPAEAFDRYLAKGKSAYVSTSWAELELAVTGLPDLAVLPYWRILYATN